MLTVFRRFRHLLRPYRGSLTLGSIMVVIVAVADVAAPWPLKIVVDNVLKGEPLRSPFFGFLPNGALANSAVLLALAIGTLVLITVLGGFADYLSTSRLEGIGERLTADLRTRTFSHLQALSLAYHDRQRVGDLTSRITGDVDHVRDMLIATLSVLVPNLLVLVGIVVVMVVADAEFTLVALSIAPLLFVSTYVFTRRIRVAAKMARRKEGEVASVATETLSSIRVVQAYTGEGRHSRRFEERNAESLAAGLQVVGLQAAFSPIVDTIATVGTAVVLIVGVNRVLSGRMSLGLLLVFLAYVSQLYKPMRNLSKLASVVSRGQASAERLFEVLTADQRVEERPGARDPGRLRGYVELRNVTFGYEAGQPVLHRVSLQAEPGEVVAIAGATGAGKSTLAGLIPRFYDPWDGQVLVDGQDVRDLTVASVRNQVALVLQDSILFHGSIYDNIAYGAEGATPDVVLEAARAAYVDEFVEGLPDGYDTVVSERGSTLSGGQRQRVAVARALVRNAPIVILDEPTSSLDAVSERFVVRSLRTLMQGRTVFVIAHRLSTLRLADRVVVLRDGRIAEAGTHGELEAESELYRGLYRTQEVAT